MSEEESGKSGARAALHRAYTTLVNWQTIIEERFRHMGVSKYSRILKMARRPTEEEYSKTLIITGAGILIIGSLGFVIYLIMDKGVPELIKFLGL